jgi:Omp85 superfamily domain
MAITGFKLLAALVSLAAFAVSSAHAKPAVSVKSAVNRAESPDQLGETLILPYAFSSESTELVFGVGGMRKGFYQDQMVVGGTAFGGGESYGGFAGVWDYRFPFSKRLFVSGTGMMGYYPSHRAYALPRDEELPHGTVRPGDNDSDPDIFLESKGDSNWLDVKLDYVLPLGAAADRGIVRYDLDNGLLVSEPTGGDTWNPLQYGVTIAMLRQYNRYQTYERDDEEIDGTIHAFELGLLHDNTDFPINPSTGSSQYIAMHYDPQWGDSYNEWSFVEAEASKYFDLGSDSWSRQRILALNAWTGYSPSWDVVNTPSGGQRVENGPPFLEGASLGGYYRMRGFRDSRFHDKAAVYAAAEFRYTLDYNPIRNVQWLQFLNLDWFQVVAFAEGGRVAPEYKASTLFEDWKTDWGVGLRALTAGIVVRFDIAHSDEGTNAWVMVGHPF